MQLSNFHHFQLNRDGIFHEDNFQDFKLSLYRSSLQDPASRRASRVV